jgi:hypothetical protein
MNPNTAKSSAKRRRNMTRLKTMMMSDSISLSLPNLLNYGLKGSSTKASGLQLAR